MALDLRQSLKLTQQLLMTPQLQQAIKLLQLSRLELEQFVTTQLVENPVLEESLDNSPEEEIYADKLKETSTDDFLSSQLGESSLLESANGERGEVDWESLSRLKETTSKKSTASRNDDDYPNYENTLSESMSLSEHLLRQAGEMELTADEQDIATKIIGNINEKGYLENSLEDIVDLDRYDRELVEGVLDCIQRFDPMGVGSRDLKECLLIQIRELKLKNGIIENIVQKCMHHLETRNFNGIAKALKISLKDVVENVAQIAALDPIPARSFNTVESQTIIPDVYVYKVDGKYVVSLNEDGLPPLKLSEYYCELSKSDSLNEKDYIQEKIKSAQWLIKSIQQRQKTIFKVTESIVDKQMEFFENGIQFLKPMILKDIAEEIGMHESTISRVTSNKYVHTPRGIYELKYFFNSSVASTQGGGVASESVKVLLKQIVDAEDPKKPFSDQRIVKFLEEKGIHLARRTVAKYREQLGILPSSKRKKYF